VSLLTPVAALFALTIPVIVALYFLRIRRPDVPLSSTLLWRRAVRDRQASVPWQRLRPSWLLILQLLAAALLVLALMRPAVTTQASLAEHTIVVIDTSMPMQATDVGPSRFDVARQRARALIDQMTASTRITLVAMDGHPRVLASSSGDPGPLRSALDSLRPSGTGADLQGALAVAASVAGGGSGTRLVLLSDGITDSLRAPLTLPFEVRYQPIGASAENLAITALTVVSQPGERDAVAHVENLGHQRQHTAVEVRADDRLVDLRPIDVEPGGGRDVVVALPARAGVVTATLTPHDALAVDDTATAVADPGRIYHITLVTQHDVFLDRALRLRSDARVTTITPQQYKPDPGVDMYVFDGMVPSPLPSQPYWLVGPPENAAVGAGAAVAAVHPRAATAADPLLANVDLAGVHIARTRDLRTSTFGRPVIESETGPLLMVRDAAPRAALLGFDIHDSDLPLRPAFPLLVDRISSFLLPETLPSRTHEPGELVQITPDAGATAISVTRPDGGADHFTPQPGGTVSFADTDEVGLYSVAEERGSKAPQRSRFAVNAFDPVLSSIAPRPTLALSGTATAAPAAAPDTRRDLWPWVAAFLLGVLCVEWVVFHRGA